MGYRAGIDIGTTYSAAALTRNGVATVFEIGGVNPSMPSVAYLTEESLLLVGDAAVRRAASDPARAAFQFKRRLGDPAPFLLGGTPYSADALTAAMLADITDRIVEREGSSPELVVITHPANYTEYKLDLLRQAARQAGLEWTAFLSEPQAAATHYAGEERIEPGESILVYDFGGGTFDAAVLSRTDDGFQLRGVPEGIERLGGIDIDEAVFGHVRASLGGVVDELDPDAPAVIAALVRLRAECRVAKEALSEDVEASIGVMLPNAHTTVRLTRIELEDMIRPRIRDTLEASRRAIRSSGLDDDAIDRVLLVGGSSRIPLVREMVREMLEAPVSLDTHPKHSVALGAARFAAVSSVGVGAIGPGPVDGNDPVGRANGDRVEESAASDAAHVGETTTVTDSVGTGSGTGPQWRRLTPLAWAGLAGVVILVGLLVGNAVRRDQPDAGDAASAGRSPPAIDTTNGGRSAPPTGETEDGRSSTEVDEAATPPVIEVGTSEHVADDTGFFIIEVPIEWSDVDSGPRDVDGIDAPSIMAAPDLEAFRASAHEPGVSIWFAPRPGVPFDQLDEPGREAELAAIHDRVIAIASDVREVSPEIDLAACLFFGALRTEPAFAAYQGAFYIYDNCGDDSLWVLFIGYLAERPDYEATSVWQARTDEGADLLDHEDFLDSVTFVTFPAS